MTVKKTIRFAGLGLISTGITAFTIALLPILGPVGTVVGVAMAWSELVSPVIAGATLVALSYDMKDKPKSMSRYASFISSVVHTVEG